MKADIHGISRKLEALLERVEEQDTLTKKALKKFDLHCVLAGLGVQRRVKYLQVLVQLRLPQGFQDGPIEDNGDCASRCRRLRFTTHSDNKRSAFRCESKCKKCY